MMTKLEKKLRFDYEIGGHKNLLIVFDKLTEGKNELEAISKKAKVIKYLLRDLSNLETFDRKVYVSAKFFNFECPNSKKNNSNLAMINRVGWILINFSKNSFEVNPMLVNDTIKVNLTENEFEMLVEDD